MKIMYDNYGYQNMFTMPRKEESTYNYLLANLIVDLIFLKGLVYK